MGGGVFFKTFLEGSVDHVIYRNYIVNGSSFIYCNLACGIKWQDQESQSAQHRDQHRVYLASGAAALGWPHHKDGRCTYAQSSLLQRAPRRKAQLWRSKKGYKHQLKWQLAQVGISHQSWQQEASDQDSWHSSVRKASHKFEAKRHEAEKERHRRQKERTAFLSSQTQTFICPKCSRMCESRIGLCNTSNDLYQVWIDFKSRRSSTGFSMQLL